MTNSFNATALVVVSAHLHGNQSTVQQALSTLSRDDLWSLKHIFEDLANTVEGAFHERPEQ